jgi:hypothetical protein
MHSLVEAQRTKRPSSGLARFYSRLRFVVRPNSASTLSAPPATRIAVLGLYRSGSSAVAGILHHLGVNMGPPFFGESHQNSIHDFYESAWLSQRLRIWWNEPDIIEKVSQRKRVKVLRRWIQDQERSGSKWIGMKHPLLSLCGPDLVEAWGSSVRYIWTCRPLENSIKSLRKLKWWSDERSDRTQQLLWAAVTEFFAKQEHLRIDFADLMANPEQQIDRLIDYLGLAPTDQQIAAAKVYVQPTSKE